MPPHQGKSLCTVEGVKKKRFLQTYLMSMREKGGFEARRLDGEKEKIEGKGRLFKGLICCTNKLRIYLVSNGNLNKYLRRNVSYFVFLKDYVRCTRERMLRQNRPRIRKNY